MRMRVTKVATTKSCAVCERTLLMGERAVSFAPTEGAELVDVCPLCQELATEAGWIKEGAPTTPTLENGRRRRRKRNLVEFLGLTRTSDEGALARQEPILRKLSDGEVALLEAADLFNGSAYRRTVGGIAKSLGEPQASIVPLRSEEHTSELQSPCNLVCRLLLEKKKTNTFNFLQYHKKKKKK